MVRVRIRVQGRVQGVGFRYHTRAQAEKLGVTGWVRNAPDGSVEAELEGDEASVENMLAWCRQGPVTARVQALDIIERADRGEKSSSRFLIRG